jgi:parallel beta-helix repeat protein
VFFSKRGIEAYDPFQTIVSNRVEMNMGSGIYVATDQGATITGNSIFLNGAGGPGFDVGAGIELGPTSRGIVMTGNLIANWAEWTQQQHRQRYGIVLRGAADSAANVHSGNAFVGMGVADVGRLA